jgi:hypothetical protein
VLSAADVSKVPATKATTDEAAADAAAEAELEVEGCAAKLAAHTPPCSQYRKEPRRSPGRGGSQRGGEEPKTPVCRKESPMTLPCSGATPTPDTASASTINRWLMLAAWEWEGGKRQARPKPSKGEG